MHVPPSVSPPERLLLGPGPSPPEPSVLAALARPTLGHLDPAFLAIMDQLRSMQRAVFQTENELTLPISGTGSAGMEAAITNLVEPGDPVLIGVNGVFGKRMCEVARRAGAEVTAVEGEWGRALDADGFRERAGGRRFKLLGVVHGETSTGVLTDVAGLRELADELGALLFVDCVTSLGGVSVALDAWGVDAAYSGTQKCLSCPPGLAPLSFSPRAQEVLAGRNAPVQSWYLDLSLVGDYWGTERTYHHTAPIQMLYGLHEALRIVLSEGLQPRWERHARNARALWAGLEAMGLTLLVPAEERLIPLTAVRVPAGVDEARVRRALLDEHGIEIGGGLGPLAGAVWRIGLMGAGSTRESVERCLGGLRDVLDAEGFTPRVDPLEAVAASYPSP